MIEAMSRTLAWTPQRVIALARNASYCYKIYTIPKRGGGDRIIYHPSKSLKSAQRWLVDNYICKLPVHTAATAYRSGTNIRHNAAVHAQHRYLLRMDFADFFQSIESRDIALLVDSSDWAERFSDADRAAFLSIVCRRGRLTIGAPSSPGLANAVCYDMDTRLTEIAYQIGASYSRYADDLFFSSDVTGALFEIEPEVHAVVAKLECPKNLKINSAKTRHLSRRHRRTITGLTIGCKGEISIDRELKRRIRATLHKFDEISEDAKRHLCGLLAFVNSVDKPTLAWLAEHHGEDLLRRAMMPPRPIHDPSIARRESPARKRLDFSNV